MEIDYKKAALGLLHVNYWQERAELLKYVSESTGLSPEEVAELDLLGFVDSLADFLSDTEEYTQSNGKDSLDVFLQATWELYREDFEGELMPLAELLREHARDLLSTVAQVETRIPHEELLVNKLICESHFEAQLLTLKTAGASGEFLLDILREQGEVFESDFHEAQVLARLFQVAYWYNLRIAMGSPYGSVERDFSDALTRKLLSVQRLDLTFSEVQELELNSLNIHYKGLLRLLLANQVEIAPMTSWIGVTENDW